MVIPKDVVGIALSVAYVGAAIGASELIRRRRGYGDEFTRKIVHVAVGLWIIPTLLLFTNAFWAALLPACAVVGNALSLKYNILRSIERGDRKDLGTVYFAASFVICIVGFFHSDFPVAAAAGIMPMALGDAAASIVGRSYGRHAYTFLGAKKTAEGSAAMFVVSLAAVFGTLILFGTPAKTAAAGALAVASVATLLEAAGKNGLDNLTVPVVSSIAAFVLLKAMEGAPI